MYEDIYNDFFNKVWGSNELPHYLAKTCSARNIRYVSNQCRQEQYLSHCLNSKRRIAYIL